MIIVPMAIGVSFLIYLALDLSPGDAVSRMISPVQHGRSRTARSTAPAHSVSTQPLLVRFWIWFTNVLQGNFGRTLTGGVPISRILAERLPATLELVDHRPRPVEHLRRHPRHHQRAEARHRDRQRSDGGRHDRRLDPGVLLRSRRHSDLRAQSAMAAGRRPPAARATPVTGITSPISSCRRWCSRS